MIKFITITNLDKDFNDCVLSAKDVKEIPLPWWRRFFSNCDTITSFSTKIWYGRRAFWTSSDGKKIPTTDDAVLFQKIWLQHVNNKAILNAKFKNRSQEIYTSVFAMKDGKWVLRDLA